MLAANIHFGLFEKGSDPSKLIPTHLESISHDLVFHDLLVCSKVKQKFINRNIQPVELEYRYRSECSPHFMEVTLYDPETEKREVLQAKIHTKETAVEKYDDAIASGNRGVLMERDENLEDLYVLSLGNIKSRMEIEIETHVVLTATLETDEEDCDKIKFYHSIPALSPETSEENEVEKTQNVRIFAKNAVKIICPSHDKILVKEGSSWKTKENVSVTREFEIEVYYEKYPFSSFTASPIKYKDFTHAGILSLIPNFAAQPSGGYELILIVDCSGSMGGSRIKCAVEALKLFFQSLDLDRKIKYNVIRFGSSFNKCFPYSVDLKDDENLEKVKKYIQETSANLGGTNMLKPIKSVFGNKARSKIKKYVNQKVCTFKYTGSNYCVQKFYNCEQCGFIGSTGVCEVCALTCHKNHRGLKETSASPSEAYCDCGEGNKNCLAMKNEFKEDGKKDEKYIKQLFLFTDGEDSYPREIEEFLRKEHESSKVRCFSFGIGRGINRTFLENCAAFTKGSACFIEDIRKEMKSQVLRQLSNAFRTSIDDVKITSGLDIGNSNIVKAKKINIIPAIFNGRSFHQYYFLKELPEKIEVEYEFLGIKSSEEVELLKAEDNSVGVRVASEFVKNSGDGNMKKLREELGLAFNLATDCTSFFLESTFGGKVFSEMKIESVSSVNKQSSDDVDGRLIRRISKLRADVKARERARQERKMCLMKKPMKGFYPKGGSSNRSVRRKSKSAVKHKRFSGKKMEIKKMETKLYDGILEQRKELLPMIPMFSPSLGFVDDKLQEKKSIRDGKTLVSGPINRSENTKKKKKKKKKRDGKDKDKEKKISLDDFEEEEEEPCEEIEEKKMRSIKTNDGSGEVKDSVTRLKTEKNIFEKQNKHSIKESVSIKNLDALLLLSNMKGIWSCSNEVLVLIGFRGDKDLFLEETKPDKSFVNNENGMSLWLTAVIIAILHRFYRKKKSEWMMISKKSLKSISSVFGDRMISESKKYVNNL